MHDYPKPAILHALLYLTLFLSACAGVPFDYPKTPSIAQAPDTATPLGDLALRWQQEHGDLSGFYGLPGGAEALGARLKIMELAGSSIDAQYFILKRDRAGVLFVTKMLNAADRGVRVRLLIDDIFSPGLDSQLTLLASHPNVQVRLFNPLSRNSLKYWNYLVEFSRANRRMHNKSFTADNSMTIVGGRNIGEEYFELKQDVMFDDYEVLAVGPVVDEVGEGFDLFWNSELAVPIEAFGVSVEPSKLDDWRAFIKVEADKSGQGTYSQAVNSSVLLDIREGRTAPVVARAELVTDTPDKLSAGSQNVEGSILAPEMLKRLSNSVSEIIIISPYFIPGEAGIEMVKKLVGRGVRVIVVTNSLASTNHVAVHSGYSRYRLPMLEAGAELYEIRVDPESLETEWGHSPEMVTLHSKVAVIDRETIFVGSLNFDPRSIVINSEMGLFIDSAAAGAQFSRVVMAGLPDVAYKLALDPDGELEWLYTGAGQHETLHREPGTSWGRRFKAGFYRLLPIEDQL